MYDMVRVDQTVAIFSGAYNNIKLLNWKKNIDGLSSVHNGLIGIAYKHQMQYNTFSHIR